MKLNKQQVGMALSLLFILILVFFIIEGLWRYISAFFGTLLLYVLFRKTNNYLRKTFLKRKGAAIITVLLCLILIIAPLFLIITLAISQFAETISDTDNIIASVDTINDRFPQINIENVIQSQVPRISEFIANNLFDSINDVTQTSIALFITFFLLYFLFIEDEKKLSQKVKELLPFSKKNSEKLMNEFQKITRATLLTSGLMALLQGTILAVLFAIFGIQAALFWGLVGAFLCFIPVVGPALLWVPVVIIETLQGRITAAVIIAIGGFLIAYIDNLLRPYLNKKIGRINQVVSLLGIFMGIAAFGLVGIIVGPIIISFFLLTVKMFKEEYLA